MTVGGLTVLKKNRPLKLALGGDDEGVIEGWRRALPTMSLGERATFRMPAELCYGRAGKGGAIPPGAALEYDLELVGVDGAYYRG